MFFKAKPFFKIFFLLNFYFFLFLNPFFLNAQEVQKDKKSNWFDWVDFTLGFSIDFAYTQTPLHYLSYLSNKNDLMPPYNSFFENSNKTVSNGIGYGLIAGLGAKVKPLSPLSLGLEYQLSIAGTSANKLSYTDGSGTTFPLSLKAGYYDHRARLYFKISPKVSTKVFLSASFFAGLAVIDLGSFAYSLDGGDNYNSFPIKDLIYQDGSLVFNKSGVYYGLDLGFRVSLYVINGTFDVAITPKFIIPRFSLAFTINDDLIRLFK